MPDFCRKREDWPRFAAKAALALGLVLTAGVAFFSRYTVAIDAQVERCLPDYRVYLVDHGDTRPVRGRLYHFRSGDLSPFYPAGTAMLKILAGVPGDHITIADNDQVRVNGVLVGVGLTLAKEKLGRSPGDFHGRTELAADQYWFLGTSPVSFDSRYWGAVPREAIVGRAYPIF